MKKLNLLKICIIGGSLLVSSQVLAKDYKLGVVLFHRDDVENNINQIKREIAGNDVYREKNGDTLQLVIQTEISWEETNPTENSYDFSKYIEYAKKLKQRGIKWTPLFSPHYTPQWAKSKYYYDLTTDKHGNEMSGNFLDFSPSSNIWNNDIKKWIEKGIEALSPYIGTGKNNTISEIFVTNEMMYHQGGFNYGDDSHNSKISTYDDATIRAWQRKYESRYGGIPRNILREGSRRRDAFMQFRAEELAYCLNNIKSHAENKLRGMGKYNIPVTWKLVPWAFDKGRGTLQQYHGLSGSQLSFLFNSTNLKMIAIDEYQHGSGWRAMKDAISSVRRFDNGNKPIYLAEFNRIGGGATRHQVKDWIINTKNYGVNNWTFFSWNGSGNGHEGPIQYEQKQGLKLAFDSIISPDGQSNDPKGNDNNTSNSSTVYSTGAYQNNMNVTKILSVNNTSGLKVTVSGEVERKWDFVKIYDSSNKLQKTYTGVVNESFNISGSSIKVIFTSDGSVTKRGITVKVEKSSRGGNTNNISNPKIESFYNTYQGYFGSKSGVNYNCGSNLICQNFTGGSGNRNKKIRVKTTNNYLYWHDNGRWNNYGIR